MINMEESKFLIWVKSILGNEKLIKAMLYGVMLLLFGLYVMNRVAVIYTTNIELTTGESNNMWNILKVLNGEMLYTNPENAPYEIFQYAPLSQYIYVGVAKLFSALDYLSLYKLYRFVNLLFNCIVALVCYNFARKHCVSVVNSLICGFVGLLLLGNLCWYVRADVFSVCFSVIACVMAYYSLQQNGYILISVFFTIMAFCAKQDAIQLFAIIPVALFMIKKYRLGLVYFFMSVVICALIFISLWLYYGDVYVDSVIKGVSMSPSITFAFGVFNRYLQLYNFLPIAIVVISLLAILKSADQNEVFLAMLVLGTFIFAIGTSMKPGGGPSYFTLANILGVLLIILFMRRFPHKKISSALVVVWAFYFYSGMMFHYTSQSFDFNPEGYENAKNVAEKLRQVLPEDFKLYTTDNYLKLELAKNTILPNAEYYPVTPFDMQNAVDDSFYIYGDVNSDWLFIKMLRKDKIHEIDTINGLKLYAYGE